MGCAISPAGWQAWVCSVATRSPSSATIDRGELAYVIEHAEVRFAMVEDQEQVDKLLEIRERCPSLEKIVYDDARGMRHYDQDFLFDIEKVIEAGIAHEKANPDFYADEVAKGKGGDESIFCYTSGTTGRPKGVVLTFDNIVKTAANAAALEGLTESEEMLAYLPMAWVGDHIFSYGQSYACGFCVSCPESGATVMQDLRELGPSYFFAPPRIFENILTTVMIRMEDASTLKRRVFHYFMGVARRCGVRLLNGEAVSFGDRLLYALGNLLVYGPLKNTLGFSRIRLAYTAGEAIGPDIFDFYRALGINLKQLYGSTEAAVFVAIQPNGEIFADTVGKPAPDVEIKIADNGEVLFRGPGVFKEYYKQPEATQETKTADGWVMTGDAGFFDERGHLKIIDRAKDVGRLNDGTLFAPKYIENKLKFFPNIKEAVAFGQQRDHVCAFINIDLGAMGSWAERNNVSYGSYQELAADPKVYDIIKGHVEQVNRDLAEDPQLGGSQVRRFLILHKELDPDDGELTRTRKVRRRIVADRYAVLIDALYGGAASCHIETEVTFEDGRKGTIVGDLQIVDVETFPVARKQAAA
jgi:long-chain acyl-CoA synthetase